MQSRTVILPLVDLVFLALGAILACMTQMDIIHALPVEISRGGSGSPVVSREDFHVLTLSPEGMSFDGQPITEKELASSAKHSKVILRAYRLLPTEETIRVIAMLSEAAAEVAIEVKPSDGCDPEVSVSR